MNTLRILRSARAITRARWQPTPYRASLQAFAYRRPYSTSPAPVAPESPEKSEAEQPPRYSITFTCTVPKCGERTSHMFTKQAYHKGIVIIECPGCNNRHLIADNLGWFKDDRTDDGVLRNIEDMMRQKGETVKRGRQDSAGVVEYTE